MAEAEAAVEIPDAFALPATDREALRLYFEGEVTRVALETQPALYDAIIRGIRGFPDAASMEAARALATERAGLLAQGIVQAELNKLADVVARGIESGAHPFEIARQLDMVTGLDSGRAGTMRKYVEYLDSLNITKAEWNRRYESMYQRQLRNRRKTIAQNEMHEAMASGERLRAEARGAKRKLWQTRGDGKVSDICAGNEADGWVPIDDEFSSGHDRPPGHVGCRCAASYMTAAPSKEDLALAKEQAAETRAAREGADAA